MIDLKIARSLLKNTIDITEFLKEVVVVDLTKETDKDLQTKRNMILMIKSIEKEVDLMESIIIEDESLFGFLNIYLDFFI